MVEMNSIPWSPVLRYATPLPPPVSTVALQHKSVSSVLRYATPLPMNRTPVSTVALQHKSVSSVLRYATPLPINRTPVLTVGGPFPSFCGTPDPFRSTRPRSEHGRSNTRLFPPLCGTPGLVSIAYSVQALSMNTTTHFVSTQPVGSHAFRFLPMNKTHSVASP